MRHALDLKKATAEEVTRGEKIAVFLIMEFSINVRLSAFLVKPLFKSGNEDTPSLSGTLDFLKLFDHKKYWRK
jgi:hypothetical protein